MSSHTHFIVFCGFVVLEGLAAVNAAVADDRLPVARPTQTLDRATSAFREEMSRAKRELEIERAKSNYRKALSELVGTALKRDRTQLEYAELVALITAAETIQRHQDLLLFANEAQAQSSPLGLHVLPTVRALLTLGKHADAQAAVEAAESEFPPGSMCRCGHILLFASARKRNERELAMEYLKHFFRYLNSILCDDDVHCEFDLRGTLKTYMVILKSEISGNVPVAQTVCLLAFVKLETDAIDKAALFWEAAVSESARLHPGNCVFDWPRAMQRLLSLRDVELSYLHLVPSEESISASLRAAHSVCVALETDGLSTAEYARCFDLLTRSLAYPELQTNEFKSELRQRLNKIESHFEKRTFAVPATTQEMLRNKTGDLNAYSVVVKLKARLDGGTHGLKLFR